MSIVKKLIDAKDPEAVKLWADGVYQQLMTLLGEGPAGSGTGTVGAGVVNIQHGTVTITGTNTSNTVTVTAVDPAKSVLHCSYTCTVDNEAVVPRWVITDATTLTFTRASGSGTTTIEWSLIEYD